MNEKNRLTLFIICSIMVSMNCSLLWQGNRASSGKIAVIPKEFPTGQAYYILYNIPQYFPKDIPYYKSGKVEKIYIYAEREMDLIISTLDPINKIVTYFENEAKAKKWDVERISEDPRADHRTVSIRLVYENQDVQTLEFEATQGKIFSASQSGKVLVCRIIKQQNSPYTVIVEQVRNK